MIRNIGKYFLFFFFFVFTLSLVNISPLFAKKEKEADKTAVDTAVCKRDATKTGAEQYSAKCKEQCTSTDEKFAKFKEDNKDACDLLQALSAPTDNPAITKEQQEIESLVQNVVEKLNKIEDTAENTAALEAIIPEFPSPTSKEFTITFSDKLRIVLEAIIFPQPVPESTATIAFVLNEATTTPETPEKTPGTTPETAEKTPIQARAEAAIKTIILKSFDPLTDTATGKYYKEVIQELRDHWLNVDLKGDATTKDTPFTVDNFKSAIFGSIGYSLPHELYHFEFDEALTKAIKDHAEADTAKKAFVEAYKKYIETNTKIEIQSNSWEEGKSLEFKISLKAGDALLDPSTKCTSTDEKSAQFQKDNTEVCKLVADAKAKAANQEVCKLVANKTGLDQYSETCRTQCISTDATFAQFQKDNAEACKLVVDATAKAANQEVCKLVANKTGLDQYSEPCKTQCTSTDAKSAQFQKDNTEVCKLVADAKAKAANQEVCKLVANKTGLDQYSETCKTQCTSTDEKFAQFKADNTDACKVIEIANATAAENAETAKTERGKAEAEKTTAEAKRDEAKNATTSTDALAFAKLSKEAADRADTAATNAEAARDRIPTTDTNRAAADTAANEARGFANAARTASNEAALAVIAKALTEANNVQTAANSTDALVEATKAATAANNAEAARDLIPDGATNSIAQTVTVIRTDANAAARYVITKANDEASTAENAAVAAQTSTLALGFAQTAAQAANNAEAALLLIPVGTAGRAQAESDTKAARAAATAAAQAVIDKALTEAQGTPGNAQNAQTSTLALGFAQTATTEADNAEAARDLIPATDATREKANTNAGAVRTLANIAAEAVITKARGEATNARNSAEDAATSTLALPYAQTADTAAKNAEAARDLIPATDAVRTAANTNAGRARTSATNAALAVITKAQIASNDAAIAARGATDSTLALVEAKKADKAADNAEAALLLIPQGAAGRGEAETNARNVRSFANQAAQAVISKATTESQGTPGNAQNAQTSTLALGFAQTAAQAAKNAEEALLLIPVGAHDYFGIAQYVVNVRTTSNQAARYVITKAKTEAAAEKGKADTEADNAEAAGGDRATALAAAGRARTAADNAATSAKNAEEALKLIPEGAANRADANTDAGRARISATNADNSADAAEAAVPNS